MHKGAIVNVQLLHAAAQLVAHAALHCLRVQLIPGRQASSSFSGSKLIVHLPMSHSCMLLPPTKCMMLCMQVLHCWNSCICRSGADCSMPCLTHHAPLHNPCRSINATLHIQAMSNPENCDRLRLVAVSMHQTAAPAKSLRRQQAARRLASGSLTWQSLPYQAKDWAHQSFRAQTRTALGYSPPSFVTPSDFFPACLPKQSDCTSQHNIHVKPGIAGGPAQGWHC